MKLGLRYLPIAASGLLLVTGCMGLTGNRTPTPPAAAKVEEKTPSPEELVAFLNGQSARVTALESRSLDIDLKADKAEFGLKGSLHCQTPKNFRMRAKALGLDEADFGSNDQEFWFWVKENQPPYLYHCSYTDLERGGVRMPFPLQPEWVLEALGMATLNPNGRYEINRHDPYVDLIERTTSPQGQPVIKVTRLNNFKASGTTPQVVGHYLYDAQNHLICSAVVSNAQADRTTGAIVPHKMRLEWPDQKMTMALTLGEITVNRPRADLPKLFQRPTEYKSVDLARNTLDGPASAIRSTGGVDR